MVSFFCLKCGHEFSSDGARMKSDRTGLFIFMGMGVVAILFAGLCFALVVTSSSEDRGDLLWYGLLSLLAGVGGVGIGRSLGKGVYAYCPGCGKPMALPSDSGSAKYEKHKRGLT